MFSDAPFSQTYKLKESILASPLHNPVNLSLDVLANPRNVSFKWYFKPADTDWELINTSDIYTVNNQGMRSELIINKFALNLTGHYRLDASNGINGVKQFNFTVKAQGAVNNWFYKSKKHCLHLTDTSMYHFYLVYNFRTPRFPSYTEGTVWSYSCVHQPGLVSRF